MRRRPKPGFLLVARREWRWLLHDRVALILIFGVPLFAFVVLTAVFSHPVIRGLGVVVVDARPIGDLARLRGAGGGVAQSQHRRARRRPRLGGAGDPLRRGHCRRLHPGQFRARPQGRAPPAGRRLLQSAVPDRRGHRLVGAERQPRGRRQARRRRRAAPKPARIGSLVAETIVLVNPERNYAQFLLRALLPMVLHVVIALAAGYAVGSEFRRRSMRTWLACAGGNPIVALAGKLAPLFAIFFVIMLSVPLILEGLFGISFKGDVPMMVVAGVAADHRLSGARRAAAASGARPGDRPRPHRPHRLAGIRLCRRRISDPRHERVRAGLGRDPAAALVHGGAARAGGARACRSPTPRARSRRWRRWPCSTRCSRSCACARSRGAHARAARREPAPAARARRAASAAPLRPSGGACSAIRGAFVLLVLAPLIYGLYYPQPYLNQILRKIPIAVVDNDLSELSRSIVQTLDASGAVSVAVRADTLAEARAALDRGEAFAVVGIPPDTERDVLKGTTAHIPIYADATYLFIFRTTAQRHRGRDQYAVVRARGRRRAHRRQPGQGDARRPRARPTSCCSRSSIRSAAMRATSCRRPSC